jgi:hypothetical protein
MIKLREQAISHRHKDEESKIDTLYKQAKISPRTYDRKRKELEVWVSKEREEVKQTKHHIENSQQKTARILSYSAQSSEQIKRILKGVEQQSHRSNVNGATDRANSARNDGRSHLIAMIYDDKHASIEDSKEASSDSSKK